MRPFDACNPIAVLIYFVLAAGFPMFLMNPAIAALSFCASVSLFVARNGMKSMRSHGFYLLMLLVMTILNPLLQHNGVTVLFVMNDNPVTLEALIYGAVSALSIVSVIYWFRSFSQIMTSDKLLYLFSTVSPKLALLLSMTLRYIPLFAAQAKKVNASQKALGLYKEDNIIDSIRGGLRVFSVMVTWTLENGIVTADSMSARGYGIGRRTRFSLFRFRKSDTLLAVVSLCLSLALAAAIRYGALDCNYYPAFSCAARTRLSDLATLFYALLAFLPSFIEIGDKIKWHCLKSGI